MQIAKKIEDTLLLLLSEMEEISKKSERNSFFVNDRFVKRNDEISALITKFQTAEMSKIPLSQAILKTSELLDLYVGIFKQIVIDNAYRSRPEYWPHQTLSLSEGGAAVFIKKRFKKFDVVDFLFAPDVNTKPIRFRGKVVNITPISEQYLERVAIEFEFPEEEEQSRVRKLLNKHELDGLIDYMKRSAS